MKIRLSQCVTVAMVSALLAAPVSLADDRNVKFGARAGTLGYGAEAGLQLHPRVNVRAILSGAEINLTEQIEGIDYDVTLALGGSGVQVDLFPLFGGLYVSGGVFANANHLELVAVPTEGITLGNTTYTPAQVGRLDGDVEFDDVATYLGLGWTGRIPFTMLEMFAEGGAYFQGEAKVRYEASGLLAEDPNFLADLNAEAQDVQDELTQYDFYPAVNLGLRLRF